MKAKQDDLLAEFKAVRESRVISPHGRDLLCELLGPECAAENISLIEWPRTAAELHRKIHKYFRGYRHAGMTVEEARQRLYAEGYSQDAVDRVIAKGPRKYSRKVRGDE